MLEDSPVLRSDEPPGADPHARWCGEGRLDAGPYPIRHSCNWLADDTRPSGSRGVNHEVAYVRQGGH
jgi:hypothetical protein